MPVITFAEDDDVEVAINLDLVTHAKMYKQGNLLLHFSGAEKNTVSVAAAHSGKVWSALTRK